MKRISNPIHLSIDANPLFLLAEEASKRSPISSTINDPPLDPKFVRGPFLVGGNLYKLPCFLCFFFSWNIKPFFRSGSSLGSAPKIKLFGSLSKLKTFYFWLEFFYGLKIMLN